MKQKYSFKFLFILLITLFVLVINTNHANAVDYIWYKYNANQVPVQTNNGGSYPMNTLDNAYPHYYYTSYTYDAQNGVFRPAGQRIVATYDKSYYLSAYGTLYEFTGSCTGSSSGYYSCVELFQLNNVPVRIYMNSYEYRTGSVQTQLQKGSYIGTLKAAYDAYLHQGYRPDYIGGKWVYYYYERGSVANSAPNVPVFNNVASNSTLNHTNPIFYWNFTDPDAGDYQTAYQIVGSKDGFASWHYNSGEVISGTKGHAMPFLGDGNWHFAVRTRDSQGVWNHDWGYVYNVKLDTTVPYTGVAHPSDVATKYTNQADGTMVRFHTINASDNLSGLYGVHFWNLREGIDGDWTHSAWGNYWYDGAYYYDMPVRGEGSYLIRAHALDLAMNGHGQNGWANEIDMRVVVDRTKPIYSHHTVTQRKLNATTFRVEVFGVADSLSGINKVQFPTWTTLHGQDDIIWHDGIHAGSGHWYADIPIASHGNEEGEYMTHIYVYDRAGNYSTGAFTTYIDSTKPTYIDSTITGAAYVHENDYWVKPGQLIKLKAKGEDVVGIKGMELSIHNTFYGGDEAANAHFDWLTMTGNKLEPPSVYAYKWRNFQYNQIIHTYQSTTVGEAELTATANSTTQVLIHDTQIHILDNANNWSNWVNLNKRIIIDGEVPLGTITPNLSAFTKEDVVLTATGNDRNGSGMKQIKLPNGNVVTSSNATYTVTTNGTYTFEFEDHVGNVTTQTMTINNIDKTAPTILFTPEAIEGTLKNIDVQTVITDSGVSGYKQYRYVWTKDETYPISGWSEWDATENPIITQTKTGKWYLHVEAEDNVGNVAHAYSGTYEKLLLSGGPSVNINVSPTPTGMWVNKPIDVYILESGDSELLAKATKRYEITNSSLYPNEFTKTIPSDKKVQLNLVGENFIHVQYILDDGTKISSTAGPYLIDTGDIGSFEMKLMNENGNEVTDWSNQNLQLLISDATSTSVSGVQKEYRIEGIHHDWQPYKEGTTINVEGKHRIFGRLVSGTGVSTEQKMVTSKIDQTKPKLLALKLVKNVNGQYDVTVKAEDSLSGIKETVLNDGTKLLAKTAGYELKGITTKPTHIAIADQAGNRLSPISFAAEPSITFEAPYTPILEVYRSDVIVNLTGATGYILGNKGYTCSSDPCQVTLSYNTTLTAVHTEGVKETRQSIKIDNIDKTNVQLILNGKRNALNPLIIDFTWNPSLTDGTLSCVEDGVTNNYPVSGTSYPLNGKNYTYSCELTGNYKGEILKSNTVDIYSDGKIPTDGTENQPVNKKTTNVYIIETKMGKSYIINAKSDNYKYNELPIPQNEITRD